jgi:flagellar hook-basal body complex protein FliE
MSIESIAALGTDMGLTTLTAVKGTSTVPQASGAFDSMLAALNQLNGDLNAGEQALRSVAAGNLDNLHQSMMGLERVRLSLQLLLQVRSRALDAYQELMRMQM